MHSYLSFIAIESFHIIFLTLGFYLKQVENAYLELLNTIVVLLPFISYMITISNWIHSFPGMIHGITAVIGLITGTYLLIAKKGTRVHFYVGRIFGISLLLVNISALFIYDFNDGKIGPFHFLIPVSLFFLLFGWIPMLRKKKSKNFMNRHIIGMIGASLGLWAAGATEYYFREIVTEGMSKGTQILNSFLISLPFAILITVLITVYLNRQKKKIKVQ